MATGSLNPGWEPAGQLLFGGIAGLRPLLRPFPELGDSGQVFLFLTSSKPASEVINEYSRKVDFLKGMLQAEKLVSRGASTIRLTWVPRSHPSGDPSPLFCRPLPQRRH